MCHLKVSHVVEKLLLRLMTEVVINLVEFSTRKVFSCPLRCFQFRVIVNNIYLHIKRDFDLDVYTILNTNVINNMDHIRGLSQKFVDTHCFHLIINIYK